MNIKKIKNEVDIDEEFMMCASIRYCVGRKTIASQAQAGYIAKRFYDRLSNDRLEFTAEDIRNEIRNSLGLLYDFVYDSTVSYNKRLPFEDFIEFLSTLDDVEKELMSISRIEVYCESYKEDEPKKFRVSRQECNVRKYLSQNDITCLLTWQRLAALFDKKRYKKIHLHNNGEESEAVVVETYVEDCEELKDMPGYFRPIPWRYKKVYMDVDKLKGGNIGNVGYYLDEYITTVEDYNSKI